MFLSLILDGEPQKPLTVSVWCNAKTLVLEVIRSQNLELIHKSASYWLVICT